MKHQFADLINRQTQGEKLTAYSILDSFDDLDIDLEPVAQWAVSVNICTLPEWKKAVRSVRRNRELKSVFGEVPETAYHFAHLFAKAYNTVFHYDGSVTMTDPETGIRTVYPAMRFARQYRMTVSTHKLGFSAHDMADATDEYLERQRDIIRAKIMSSVTYDAAASFDWIGIAKATCTDDPEYAAALMQHFIWQVKRKNAGIPVLNHLMLIFGGAQDVGKSTFAKLLFAPINDLHREATFDAITDERNIDLWNSPVIFMDEMAFASKADADLVKNVITATTIDRRPMRTNSQQKIRQMATFIGTTNQVLGQLIRDATGLRRFGFLNFQKQPDYATINAADMLSAWRSVDERAESPIIPHLTKLRSQQEQSRQKSTVEQWIETIDEGRAPMFIEAQGRDVIRREKLFEDYDLWCQRAGVNPRVRLDQQGMVNELKRLSTNTDDPVFRFKKGRTANGFTYHGPHPTLEMLKVVS